MRKVPIEEAIGLTLGHDITQIIPGQSKIRAFKRGHVITADDLARLLDLGKEHIYVWEPDDTMIHEDEAAWRIASAAAGNGVELSPPSQGKVNLCSKRDGLLKIQVEHLNLLNNLPDLVFATLHNNRVVAEGQVVAGTRVVPIAIENDLLEQAEKLAASPLPLLQVKPFLPLWVAVVTTGSEVNKGLIKDGFAKVTRQKIAPFGGRWLGQVIVPDNTELIANEINNFIAEGAQLILVTGGMSVDADDQTPRAIRSSGAQEVFYGAPVLPGSQFMLAYQGHVAICGVPGGALFSRKTTLDLILPRLFAADTINRSEIVALGHGGLCEECDYCYYPQCSFGKSCWE